MKYIVAIGGGDIRKMETFGIDKKIVSLSKKKNPNLLFIPTASNDSEGYVETIKDVYGQKLSCKIDVLYLLREKPTKHEIKRKIDNADIIYVGGGNTLKMMKLWRKLGVDKLLLEAYEQGTILCGISAGAICWFEYGHSDSMSFYDPKNWQYIRVKGLGIIPGTLCPHYNSSTLDIPRETHFKKMVVKYGRISTAIDDQCAILFQDNQFEVISTQESAHAYKIRKNNGEIHKVVMPKGKLESFKLLFAK